ncbi:MAG: hypothetical protein AAB809_00140 [Patescibacteria group bacterium]
MEIKIFKIKKKFKKGGIHVNPSVYWNIIQGITFFAIVGSFVFGFSLFRKINKEFISSAENTDKQAETISKERIDRALEYFSDRENKSESILNSPSPIIDPSL